LHLDLHLHSSRTAFLLLATSIGHAIHETNKTSTTEEKYYKNAIKERARTYKHKGARNIENRAVVEKTQLSKDLYYNKKENYKLNLF